MTKRNEGENSTMTKRKAISTRTRFEIFKRDGFRCVYCGATPLQSPLHVDHVKAVANGGTNDPANLITACEACNGGKSAVPLDQRKFKVGDKEQAQEHLEQIKAYLDVQEQIDDAKREVIERICAYWEKQVGPMSEDMAKRMKHIVGDWPPEKILEAIDITARRIGGPEAEYNYRDATKQAKYFHGILRRWREEKQQDPPPPPPKPAPKISARATLVFERLRRVRERLEAKGENNIDNIVREFALLAYIRPEDLDYTRYHPEYPDIPVRGLVLCVEKRGEFLHWRVEDDPSWLFEEDLPNGIMMDEHDVSLAIHEGDLERAKTAWRELSAVLREAVGFRGMVRGEEGAEEYLLRVRSELGWANPEVP